MIGGGGSLLPRSTQALAEARRDLWLAGGPNERSIVHFRDDSGKHCIQCRVGDHPARAPRGRGLKRELFPGLVVHEDYWEALDRALAEVEA